MSDRIGANVAVAVEEQEFYDDKIVDVFQILADTRICEAGVTAANDKISARSRLELMDEVPGHCVEAFTPPYFRLGPDSSQQVEEPQGWPGHGACQLGDLPSCPVCTGHSSEHNRRRPERPRHGQMRWRQRHPCV